MRCATKLINGEGSRGVLWKFSVCFKGELGSEWMEFCRFVAGL